MMMKLMQRIERIERQLHNILLLGSIEQADYAKARVKVRVGDLVSGWLPWLTARASHDTTWHAPEIGEQVLVLSPSGELGNAVVLPAIYQNAHPANANSADKHTTTYKDGAVIEYDRGLKHLKAILPAGGTTELYATGGIHFTGDVLLDGNLIQNGNQTVTGGITTAGDVVAAGIGLDTHVHGGILPGGASTAGPQ